MESISQTDQQPHAIQVLGLIAAATGFNVLILLSLAYLFG